ncbi:MAG: hypothetical protein ACRC9L_02415 [Brevinema sp.]
MIKYTWLFFLFPIFIFSNEFWINVEQTGPREILFNVEYDGNPKDIILPHRVKIVQAINSNLLKNVGEDLDEDITDNYYLEEAETITFSYSIFLTEEPEYGNLIEDWYPTVKGDENSSYKLTITENKAFIFPYRQLDDGTYSFSTAEKPKMAISRFVRLPESGFLPVTIYSSLGVDATHDEIRRIYEHNVSIYGYQNINEIVIVNNPRIPEDIFWTAGKLFISMPSRGTINQFSRLIPDAWMNVVPSLSARLFKMIKDSVLRLKPLSTPPNNEGPYVSDPLWVEPVGSKSYYSSLFEKGLDNNGSGIELVDVNAAALIENKSMLSLAQKHIGVEDFFAGVKQMFEVRLAAEENKPDYEQLDWDSLLQDKLSEPLLSFFKKDAFRPGFNASLSIESNMAIRNSQYIPNFSIQQDTGVISIEWNGSNSSPLNTDALWVQLDRDRLIPRLDYLSSYMTRDTNEQRIREKVMMAAQRLKSPSVSGFRTHYECMSFPAPENPYDVAEGTPVYVVVSLVSTMHGGTLKPAIQEAFFIMNETERPMHITTRLRL